MKKLINILIITFFAAAVVLSACHALGVFGDESLIWVDGKKYPIGGFTYIGELKNGKFNGVGWIYMENGENYTGGFADGRFEGEGTFTDADGNIIYSGGFKNGLFDGYGVYTSPGGWSYEGNFKEGLFDGYGAFYAED